MAKNSDKLNAKYQDAIRLKYEGETYAAIAKALKTPLSTVQKWFAFGGLLKDEYEKYRDEQNEFKKAESQEILRKNLAAAASMMVTLLSSKDDNVRFRAAKEILDRELGSPKETIEHQGLFGTDLSYEQILRKAREKPPPDG
jgi:transposase